MKYSVALGAVSKKIQSDSKCSLSDWPCALFGTAWTGVFLYSPVTGNFSEFYCVVLQKWCKMLTPWLGTVSVCLNGWFLVTRGTGRGEGFSRALSAGESALDYLNLCSWQ
jgi:hypothetical protein